MAITTKWYGLGLQYLLDNPLDAEQATLKMALVANTYTPDRDAHDFWDDVSSHEVANGDGYTTGGVTLANVAWSYDDSSQRVLLDFDDPSWTFTDTVTWRYAVIYADTAGASSADPVLALLDWGSDQSVSTQYTLQIPSGGLLYLDVT